MIAVRWVLDYQRMDDASPVPPDKPENGPLAEALRSIPLGPERGASPASGPSKEPEPSPTVVPPPPLTPAQPAALPLHFPKTPNVSRPHAWGFEWRSRASFFGVPLVHVAIGRDERGRYRLAKGIVAVGQFAIGIITVAQFGLGVLAGVGQLIFGTVALAQFACGTLLGIGQFATGFVAFGQFVLGYYAFGQAGWARALWSLTRHDAAAGEFFRSWAGLLGWTL